MQGVATLSHGITTKTAKLSCHPTHDLSAPVLCLCLLLHSLSHFENGRNVQIPLFVRNYCYEAFSTAKRSLFSKQGIVSSARACSIRGIHLLRQIVQEFCFHSRSATLPPRPILRMERSQHLREVCHSWGPSNTCGSGST